MTQGAEPDDETVVRSRREPEPPAPARDAAVADVQRLPRVYGARPTPAPGASPTDAVVRRIGEPPPARPLAVDPRSELPALAPRFRRRRIATVIVSGGVVLACLVGLCALLRIALSV